jgi:hypothetical protein
MWFDMADLILQLRAASSRYGVLIELPVQDRLFLAPIRRGCIG